MQRIPKHIRQAIYDYKNEKRATYKETAEKFGISARGVQKIVDELGGIKEAAQVYIEGPAVDPDEITVVRSTKTDPLSAVERSIELVCYKIDYDFALIDAKKKGRLSIKELTDFLSAIAPYAMKKVDSGKASKETENQSKSKTFDMFKKSIDLNKAN